MNSKTQLFPESEELEKGKNRLIYYFPFMLKKIN